MDSAGHCFAYTSYKSLCTIPYEVGHYVLLQQCIFPAQVTSDKALVGVMKYHSYRRAHLSRNYTCCKNDML